jgi:hypothetical protein
MQSYLTPPGFSMTSGIALHDAIVGQFVDDDDKFDRSASDLRRDATEDAGERLRLPLLILFPITRMSSARRTVARTQAACALQPSVKRVRLVTSIQGRRRGVDLEGSGRVICQKRPVLRNYRRGRDVK